MKERKPRTKGNLRPVSLHSLTPSQAIHAAMQVDPEKVLEAERKAGIRVGKKGKK